ncbi:C2 domain [Phytophthora cactorum]|nr:C2 domain [Phytophthora cactorum]
MRATHFYVNLTSLTVTFSISTPVSILRCSLGKAENAAESVSRPPNITGATSSGKRRLQLASTADIEHAFSYAAYVCKRSGLSDTALVEMLQARHLVNLHARFEISTVEAGSDQVSELPLDEELEYASGSLLLLDSSHHSKLETRKYVVVYYVADCKQIPSTEDLEYVTETNEPHGEFNLPHIDPLFLFVVKSVAIREDHSDSTVVKAQIADIECRRWASSAFVGKMIGIRVAREMISHFRAELDMWFRHGDDVDSPTHAMTISTSPGQRHYHRVKLHREFLDELCTPLCEQFQVDRNYVYEAALAVMHPHAYLHIVEVCFLLSELGRVSTLRKWVEYVSLSMLHSCSTFASCSIAEDVYRDWEGLTIQLCYILNLDAQGIIFLGWARQRSDIVRQAVTLPFYTYGTVAAETYYDTTSEDNISLLSWGGIDNAASQNQFKIRKMYTLILMVSVLRTLYARATVFLSTYQESMSTADEGGIETDIASSLFTPQKLWKALGEGPLEGLNAVAPEDGTENESPGSLQAFLGDIGMSFELHAALVNASDDYVLLLMQNAGFGVQTTLRRFRIDPRVYVKSFVLRDAFSWFARHEIFKGETEADTIAQVHAFLGRCCKQRKLRLLVAHRGEDSQMFPLDHHHARPHQDSSADTHSVTSEHSLPRSRFTSAIGSDMPTSESGDKGALPEAFYLQSMMFVDPGKPRRSGISICSETCDEIVDSAFEDPDLVAMWKTTGGEGWLVTAITQYRLDGLHSYRTLHQHIQRGLAGNEEPRVPLLVEIYSRSQRNAMFEVAGLPHRFVGVITVDLVEAKDLIPCSWIGKWSDAYVFLELCHAKEKPRETAEEWSLQTYRSPVGEGGVNPHWDSAENKFAFRFAIPTHGKHTARPTRNVHFSNGGGHVRKVDVQASHLASQLWNADVNDLNRDAVDALGRLLPSVFSGPPAMLRCTVYQKNKVLSHQFMGRAKVPLDELTSGNPMDCWLPLEDTSSGSLHVKISLSFQLMCSSIAGLPELKDLR